MSNYGWVPRIDDADDYLTHLALLVSRRPNMEMIEIRRTRCDGARLSRQGL